MGRPKAVAGNLMGLPGTDDIPSSGTSQAEESAPGMNHNPPADTFQQGSITPVVSVSSGFG